MRSLSRIVLSLGVVAALSCGGDSPGSPSAPQPDAVSVVVIAPAQLTLNVGESATLSASARSATGAVLQGRSMAWSSGSASVATVDNAGVVRGVSPGTAIITATSEGRSGVATVTVVASVATLFIDSIQPPLIVGRTAQLAFEVRDANNQAMPGRIPQWVSSNPAAIVISASGLMTGMSSGTSTISGTIDGKTAAKALVAQVPPAVVLALEPSIATVARGVDYTLTAKVTDFNGAPLSGKTVAYTTSDPAIATVTATGVVRPIANGVATITATVDGEYQSASRVTVTDPRAIAGTVFTADGAPLPGNLAFTATTGVGSLAQRFSATVDSLTGAFVLRMPTLPSQGPAAEFFADVPAGTTRRYHPAYQRLASGLVPSTPRILLIPHRVVPDSGTYAGRVFDVSLHEAFTAVCANTSDANCQSYWPSYWLPGIKMWADEARPVPVAFDRTVGSVTPADSVSMWATIAGMEADVGRRLFRPDMFKGYTSTGYTTGMILISRDSSVAPFAGYTNWFWDGQGVLYQAKIRLANAQIFANTSTSTHELNHALGFHHTCRWATIMGGYGCGQQGRLSPTDVAYYHLAEMVRRRAKATSANWSIDAGLQGTRVLELGMSPAVAIPPALLPFLNKAVIPGSDGSP